MPSIHFKMVYMVSKLRCCVEDLTVWIVTMSDKLNRHEQRKAATHQSLIDAARELIVERGYNNVDILDITDRANVSKATFYIHFANKEACVRELMEQGFDALADELLCIEQDIEPEWVYAKFERIFVWARENRELLLIMVGGAASSQLNVFGREYMVRVTEETLMTRRFKMEPQSSYPPAVMAQVVTGIMIQLLGWWLENDTGYSAAEIAQMFQDILRFGLGKPGNSENTFTEQS